MWPLFFRTTVCLAYFLYVYVHVSLRLPSITFFCTLRFFVDFPCLVWFPISPHLKPPFYYVHTSVHSALSLLCFPPLRLFCCFHMSDGLHVCLSQTKMSAARTTEAASTSASTQWALMFVSVAMALYCMRTNMTVRKVGSTRIHISTHTGIKTLECTCTCCHTHTNTRSFTRTAIDHLTVLTMFIHIRVHMTTDWFFPFEDRFIVVH